MATRVMATRAVPITVTRATAIKTTIAPATVAAVPTPAQIRVLGQPIASPIRAMAAKATTVPRGKVGPSPRPQTIPVKTMAPLAKVNGHLLKGRVVAPTNPTMVAKTMVKPVMVKQTLGPQPMAQQTLGPQTVLAEGGPTRGILALAALATVATAMATSARATLGQLGTMAMPAMTTRGVSPPLGIAPRPMARRRLDPAQKPVQTVALTLIGSPPLEQKVAPPMTRDRPRATTTTGAIATNGSSHPSPHPPLG